MTRTTKCRYRSYSILNIKLRDYVLVKIQFKGKCQNCSKYSNYAYMDYRYFVSHYYLYDSCMKEEKQLNISKFFTSELSNKCIHNI